MVVASHGTLPKVCSEPVALRSRDSPCKESRSVSDCAVHVLLGGGVCIFGHSKGGFNDVLCVDHHWEDSMAPLAPHVPFAPQSHVGLSWFQLG